jgi:D-sedoheptulose 7-phosphate isomerase
MMTNILRANIDRSSDTHSRALTVAAESLITAYAAVHKALFFGDGGSTADALHLDAEFVGRYLRQLRPLPALALNSNSSVVTAIGNDYGYEEVFARQIDVPAVPGDAAFAASTSGNSPSVIQGVMCARSLGQFTIGLTGTSGGRLHEFQECSHSVPDNDGDESKGLASGGVLDIRGCHILLGHARCDAVEQAIVIEQGCYRV